MCYSTGIVNSPPLSLTYLLTYLPTYLDFQGMSEYPISETLRLCTPAVGWNGLVVLDFYLFINFIAHIILVSDYTVCVWWVGVYIYTPTQTQIFAKPLFFKSTWASEWEQANHKTRITVSCPFLQLGHAITSKQIKDRVCIIAS